MRRNSPPPRLSFPHHPGPQFPLEDLSRGSLPVMPPVLHEERREGLSQAIDQWLP